MSTYAVISLLSSSQDIIDSCSNMVCEPLEIFDGWAPSKVRPGIPFKLSETAGPSELILDGDDNVESVALSAAYHQSLIKVERYEKPTTVEAYFDHMDRKIDDLYNLVMGMMAIDIVVDGISALRKTTSLISRKLDTLRYNGDGSSQTRSPDEER